MAMDTTHVEPRTFLKTVKTRGGSHFFFNIFTILNICKSFESQSGISLSFLTLYTNCAWFPCGFHTIGYIRKPLTVVRYH